MKYPMKIAQGLAAVSLAAAALAGCSSSSGNEGSPSASTSSSSPTAASSSGSASPSPSATNGPPDELTMVVYDNNAPYDNFSIHYIEEQTNTKLNIIPIAGNELENKLNIMLASGDRPDIIQFGSDDTEWKYTKSGLLLPIDEYFKQAPSLEAFGEDGTWDAMLHDDGHIYAVPIKGSTIDNIPLYRKDWLDKLGLSVPTTIDEFVTVAEAFANNDPDGDGKKDTYALSGFTTSNGFDLASWDQVFGAFGVLPNFWVEQNGKVVNGSVADGMLDALKVLNKLYKDKAIDLEFVTDNSSRFKEKVVQGVIGAPVYRTFLLDPNNIYNYYKPMKEVNPNAEFIEGGILKGPGTSIGPRTLTKRGWLKTAVLKESKHVDAAIRLLDYLSSEEGNRFVNYGLEGKHYEVKDGMVTPLLSDEELAKEGVNQLKLAFNSLYEHTSDRFREVFDYAKSIGYTSPVDGIFLENNTKASELDGFASTQFTKMVTATGPIDDMFNNFVKEWNKRGGEDLTKRYNEAYQKRLAAKQ